VWIGYIQAYQLIPVVLIIVLWHDMLVANKMNSFFAQLSQQISLVLLNTDFSVSKLQIINIILNAKHAPPNFTDMGLVVSYDGFCTIKYRYSTMEWFSFKKKKIMIYLMKVVINLQTIKICIYQLL
jgi:hypothetical protein